MQLQARPPCVHDVRGFIAGFEVVRGWLMSFKSSQNKCTGSVCGFHLGWNAAGNGLL